MNDERPQPPPVDALVGHTLADRYRISRQEQDQFALQSQKKAERANGNEKHPSGAKARIDFAALAARLKSCPFKTATLRDFY